MKWTRGFVIQGLRETCDLKGDELARREAEEATAIYDGFSAKDFGRSRSLVCRLDPANNLYEVNAALVQSAPEMRQLLLRVRNEGLLDDEADLRRDVDRVLARIDEARRRAVKVQEDK